MSEVRTPFEAFRDTDGTPLDGGYVYIGVENQEPITHPALVFWDSDLTIAAAQPIRTLGGYPVHAGAPANVYVGSNYSITVKNKRLELVVSLLRATSIEANLADSTSALRNAGMVAYDPSLPYEVGSVGAALQTSSPSSSLTYAEAQNQTYVAFATGGTAPAYALTPSPALSSLVDGQELEVAFTADGTTGSNTLNVSALGAKALKQFDSSGSLVSGVTKNGFITKVRYNGTYWVILNPLPTASTSTGRLIGVTYYSTAGTTAYVKGTNNPTFVIVEVQGPGGSGARAQDSSKTCAATGGSAGGFSRKKILASALAASETITIGTGGTAITAGTSNGNDGSGASSFGSHCSGSAGLGGKYATAAAGSVAAAVGVAGGSATGGDLNITGGGSSAASAYSGGNATAGGNSFYGGGGKGANNLSTDNVSAGSGGAPGAGGGGETSVSSSAPASGAGADGMVTVWEYS